MKGIFLDSQTINRNDMDMSGIRSVLSDLQLTSLTTNSSDVLAHITGKAVVISNKVELNATVLKSAQQLRLVCIAATGMNNIDLQAASENNIVVCNVESYANESVSQHVFGLIISLLRNFQAYKVALDNKDWHNSRSFSLLSHPIEDLSEKTLGIIGYGEIGKTVAKLAQCFGMHVVIAEHHGIPIERLRAGRQVFDSVLEQADIITLHCPLTTATKNLISETQFHKMKPSCILINTARGGVVNEQDLLTALQKGTIAAAGIDVLRQEPPGENSILLQNTASSLGNLIITPHIAWASRQARQNLLNKLAQNIRIFSSGTYRKLSNFYY